MEENELLKLDLEIRMLQKEFEKPNRFKSGFIILILLIINIVTIIIFASNIKDIKKEKKITYIGEIECLFLFKYYIKKFRILGEEFNEKNNDFEIYLDDKKINKVKEYYLYDAHFTDFNITIKFKLISKLNMDYMFKDLPYLNSISMHSSKNVKITSMRSSFENCTHLKILEIKGFDTSNVQDMSKTFKGCLYLEELDLSSFNTKNVKNMSSIFDGLNYIRNLSIENFKTSKVEDMSFMFRECFNLINLKKPKFDTSKVIDMSYMFYYSRGVNFLI